MSSKYVQPTGRLALSRVSRALDQLRDQTEFSVEQSRAAAIVASADIDSLTVISQRAMQGVAFTSQVEQELAKTVPLAASRLEAIGNLAALGMGQILADAVNQMRGHR